MGFPIPFIPDSLADRRKSDPVKGEKNQTDTSSFHSDRVSNLQKKVLPQDSWSADNPQSSSGVPRPIPLDLTGSSSMSKKFNPFLEQVTPQKRSRPSELSKCEENTPCKKGLFEDLRNPTHSSVEEEIRPLPAEPFSLNRRLPTPRNRRNSQRNSSVRQPHLFALVDRMTWCYNGSQFGLNKLGQGQYHNVYEIVSGEKSASPEKKPCNELKLTIRTPSHEAEEGYIESTVTKKLSEVVLRITKGDVAPRRATTEARNRGVTQRQLEDINGHQTLFERGVPVVKCFANPETIYDAQNPTKYGGVFVLEKLNPIEEVLLGKINAACPQHLGTDSLEGQLYQWVVAMFGEDFDFLQVHGIRKIFDFKPDNIMYSLDDETKSREYCFADLDLSPTPDDMVSSAMDVAKDVFKWSRNGSQLREAILALLPEAGEYCAKKGTTQTLESILELNLDSGEYFITKDDFEALKTLSFKDQVRFYLLQEEGCVVKVLGEDEVSKATD